jgi:DNA-binding transcriptional ArsR family regulator
VAATRQRRRVYSDKEAADLLRIHFTGDDLARTRMVADPDPLWETVLSLHQMQDRDPPPVFRRWRHDLLTMARECGIGRDLHLLAAVDPVAAYFPDFLTPAASRSGLDTGLDALLSTPKSRLAVEFARLAGGRPLPSWMRPFADGEPAMLRRLGGALRSYHRIAVAPHHERIRRDLDTHRQAAARALLDSGHDGLLAALGPDIRWRPPVLEAAFPQERTIRLDGRGITLVPSYFCWRTVTTLADPELPPVLVYPVERSLPWLGPVTEVSDALATLLGPTRAAVLSVLAVPHTTMSLADRVGIAPGTVSHHTAVLRDAGLISTERRGRTARHTLTALGGALVARAGESGH